MQKKAVNPETISLNTVRSLCLAIRALFRINQQDFFRGRGSCNRVGETFNDGVMMKDLRTSVSRALWVFPWVHHWAFLWC